MRFIKVNLNVLNFVKPRFYINMDYDVIMFYLEFINFIFLPTANKMHTKIIIGHHKINYETRLVKN